MVTLIKVPIALKGGRGYGFVQPLSVMVGVKLKKDAGGMELWHEVLRLPAVSGCVGVTRLLSSLVPGLMFYFHSFRVD